MGCPVGYSVPDHGQNISQCDRVAETRVSIESSTTVKTKSREAYFHHLG